MTLNKETRERVPNTLLNIRRNRKQKRAQIDSKSLGRLKARSLSTEELVSMQVSNQLTDNLFSMLTTAQKVSLGRKLSQIKKGGLEK